MKKKIFPTLTISLILVFTTVLFGNCTEKDDTTIAKITVKSALTIPMSKETVYLFKNPTSHSEGKDPKHARTSAITNENGVAVFELNSITDLKWLSKETTLYFTVFKTKKEEEPYEVAGTVVVTVTKGQTSEGEISVGALL